MAGLFDTLREKYKGYSDDEILSALQATKYAGYGIDEIRKATGYEPPKRSLFAVANDMVIEGANAIAGAAGSAADFVAPGNRFSRAVDEFVQSGEESQSEAAKLAKRQFREDVANADGVMGELGAVGRYVTGSPLLALSQAAGSFAIPGVAVTGAGALAGQGARLVGASRAAQAAAASRAGLAGGAVAGGALAGGDAAGTAYDLVIRAGGTEEEAQAAAREASLLPAAIGAAGGLVGAERILAGAGGVPRGSLMSRAFKTGLIEGGQEAVEEGVTQYEGQRVAVPFDPSLDPTKGVAAAAGMGFAMGAPVGAATGAIDAYRNPSPLPKPPAPPRDNGAEAARKLAEAGNVGDMAAAATELAMAPLSPQRADAALSAFEQRAADDQADIKQQGRMDRTGLPPLPAREPDPARQPSAAVADTPFGDRVLTLREQLADPQVRQTIREQFGDDALGTVAYYATIADDTTKPMPDKTRDRLLGLAEGIVSRALLRPVDQPGLESAAPQAPDRVGLAPRAARIGLDTAPTGRMRVNAAGSAAPETRADVINDRQRAAERPDGFEQQVQGRPLPRDFTMVGEGELTTPQRRAPAAQPTLLLTRDNQPYGTMSAATIRARKEGGEVVEVPGGWAVRKETTDVADPGRDGIARPPDAIRGDRDPELRQQRPADVAVDAAAPDAQGMGGVAPDAVRPGERRSSKELRGEDAWQDQARTRNGEEAITDLRDVEKYARPLPEQEQQGVSKLRAGRGDDMPAMGEQLQSVPGRRGGEAVEGTLTGSNLERQGLPAGQRPVGNTDGAGAEQAQQRSADTQRKDGDSRRMGGNVEPIGAYAVRQDSLGDPDRQSAIDKASSQGSNASNQRGVEVSDRVGADGRTIDQDGAYPSARGVEPGTRGVYPGATAAEPLKARLERARKKPAQPEAAVAKAEQAAAPKTKRPPKSFRKKVTVTTEAFVEESGKFEPRETDADSALTALDEDIAELEAFRRCITGS